MAVATVFYITSETLTQPGLERFEGKINELGFYRNENNTGPVLRVYAAEVVDADLAFMKEYGDAMPHTKYGKTLVFFLKENSALPFTPGATEPYLPADLQQEVVATYTKSPMGESALVEVKTP